MKFRVEMLALGNWGDIREVEVPHHTFTDIETTLEKVFEYGQNEVQPQQRPSVSMGDVIVMDTDKWLIRDFGFRLLTPTEYSEYTRMAQRDRHICHLVYNENIRST
jgi:hypothetical protein